MKRVKLLKVGDKVRIGFRGYMGEAEECHVISIDHKKELATVVFKGKNFPISNRAFLDVDRIKGQYFISFAPNPRFIHPNDQPYFACQLQTRTLWDILNEELKDEKFQLLSIFQMQDISFVTVDTEAYIQFYTIDAEERIFMDDLYPKWQLLPRE